MDESITLGALFASSFLAATLLPGGSEAVLFGVLKMHPHQFWPALLVATLGVWAIKTIDDQEALRKCLGAGRRDCVKIAAPPSGVVQPVR